MLRFCLGFVPAAMIATLFLGDLQMSVFLGSAALAGFGVGILAAFLGDSHWEAILPSFWWPGKMRGVSSPTSTNRPSRPR